MNRQLYLFVCTSNGYLTILQIYTSELYLDYSTSINFVVSIKKLNSINYNKNTCEILVKGTMKFI